jgi:CDP-diacylglycerol--glycerol-3-phosphate 3-phosphatidyltransferase
LKTQRRHLALQLLTVARIPLAVLFVLDCLYLKKAEDQFFIGLVLLLCIEASDFLDGRIARRFGLESEFGATLDPFSDSLSRLLVYWGLAQQKLVLAAVPLIMAVRDLTVAYCRIVLARHGRSVKANFSGKLKAVVQAAGAFIAWLFPLIQLECSSAVLRGLSWIVILCTAYSSLEYLGSAWQALPRESDR